MPKHLLLRSLLGALALAVVAVMVAAPVAIDAKSGSIVAKAAAARDAVDLDPFDDGD
jgi:hypothetical protein